MMSRLSAIVVVTATMIGQASAAEYFPAGGGEEAVYIGCFHDDPDDRVLGDMIMADDMTTGVRGQVEFRRLRALRASPSPDHLPLDHERLTKLGV